MTRDDMIRLARQAHGPITGQWWDMDVAALERFAALVAAAEREACAKVADYMSDFAVPHNAVAIAIRARGEKK